MKKSEEIHRSIKNKIYAEYSNYLDKTEIQYLESKFGKSDTFLKSITLVPYLLYSCIRNTKHTVAIKDLTSLGFLNIKACVAYTIYDYIHDGKIEQKYQSKLLSLANIFLQDFIQTTCSIISDKQVLNEIQHLFKTMDAYYCSKQNRIDTVYEKSIGLYIIPFITLYKAGFGTHSKETKAFKTLFISYLTARQLSDDLDDMEYDIKIQNITPVVLLYQKNKDTSKTTKIIRKIIDTNLSTAKNVLLLLKNIDGQRFVENYIREC